MTHAKIPEYGNTEKNEITESVSAPGIHHRTPLTEEIVEQLLARGRTVNSSKHQTMLAIAAIRDDDTDDIVQKKIQMTAKFVDDFATVART